MNEKTILTRDGVRLSVREYGNAAAPNTYVFAHGWCLNKNSWNLQAEHLVETLGDQVRVITYDHRGHGASEETDISAYTLPQLAHDLADVLLWMGVRGNVTLAGHSMGGMTVMQYMALPADERPVEPDHLALVATSAGDLVNTRIGSLLNRALPETPVKAALKRTPSRIVNPLLKSMSLPITSLLIRAVAYEGEYDREIARLCVQAINNTPLHTIMGFALGIKYFDARGTLKDITTDTVVVSGGKDFLTPPSHSDLMEKSIPKARRRHFNECGHMVLHEAYDELNAALRGFAVTRELVAV